MYQTINLYISINSKIKLYHFSFLSLKILKERASRITIKFTKYKFLQEIDVFKEVCSVTLEWLRKGNTSKIEFSTTKLIYLPLMMVESEKPGQGCNKNRRNFILIIYCNETNPPSTLSAAPKGNTIACGGYTHPLQCPQNKILMADPPVRIK